MADSSRASSSAPLRADDQPSAGQRATDDFPVTLTSGSLFADGAQGWLIPHVWTEGGVFVQAAPNGAGVLHVAVALCVLNDVYREGEALGVPVQGVRVGARGVFDTESWLSTGITYVVDVDSTAPDDEVARLVARVDEIAEIPRVLRAGMSVERADG
jgi:hypothetical protein